MIKALINNKLLHSINSTWEDIGLFHSEISEPIIICHLHLSSVSLPIHDSIMNRANCMYTRIPKLVKTVVCLTTNGEWLPECRHILYFLFAVITFSHLSLNEINMMERRHWQDSDWKYYKHSGQITMAGYKLCLVTNFENILKHTVWKCFSDIPVFWWSWHRQWRILNRHGREVEHE